MFKNKGTKFLAIGIIFLIVALLMFCFVESNFTIIFFIASIIFNATGIFILTSKNQKN